MFRIGFRTISNYLLSHFRHFPRWCCFYALFNRLIRQEGALFTSFSNYIVPVIGMILGFFFLHEALSIQQLIGMGVIMMSLVLSDEKIISMLIRN
ncbi:EamA family transporter [Peribacillus butanolivorans]|uniref:EamA family transporter n=1 Tax=Peribacillus butanolivorans TaxID=421767 RepID=UPI0035D7E5C6